jgi:hypoxanthine phosphoribosyltransferase
MRPPSRSPTDDAEPARRRAAFAHNAEAQVAKLFDFYGVAWEYEPHTFELEWDDDGRVTRAFTPDFYLPDHDLFIEVTTLRQELVTRKNAKVRRLRALHPDVNVKVLYQRDYLALLAKYGLEEPEQWEASSAVAEGDAQARAS